MGSPAGDALPMVSQRGGLEQEPPAWEGGSPPAVLRASVLHTVPPTDAGSADAATCGMRDEPRSRLSTRAPLARPAKGATEAGSDEQSWCRFSL